MDRSTFSTWGSLICVVLVVAIMMAFATPFGAFITSDVKSAVSSIRENATLDVDLSDILGDSNEHPENPETPDAPDTPEEPTEPEDAIDITPGLYQTGAIELYKAQGAESVKDMLIKSWNDLLADETVHIDNGIVYSNADIDEWENASSDILTGDLVLPNDGSITALGDLDENEWEGRPAFAMCKNLTGITIPNSVTFIGDSAFCDCDALTVAEFDEGIQISSIPASMFASCKSLKSITIPNGVQSIGLTAFTSNSSLESVFIPSSVEAIDKYAFSSCANITNITFGESSQLTRIGDSAFLNCKSLTSIDIPDGVTSIGRDAFSSCTNLKTVYFEGSLEQWINITFATQTSSPCNYKANLYIDGVLLDEIIIPSVIKEIPKNTFKGCSNITKVTFEENSQLTTIGHSAFYGCEGLTNITIPESVTTIEACAFAHCPNITSITIPDSVTSIGNSAFLNCTGLASIDIPDGVTSIGSGTFSDCTGLTNITIPDGVTSIGNSAFDSCTGLTSIEIPASVAAIGKYAFMDCTNLKTVTFGKNSQLTTVGEYAFSGCAGLTSIQLSASVTSIDKYAFFQCQALKSVYFKGTKNQWNAITKGTSWNFKVPATYVQCSDGQVSLS